MDAIFTRHLTERFINDATTVGIGGRAAGAGTSPRRCKARLTPSKSQPRARVRVRGQASLIGPLPVRVGREALPRGFRIPGFRRRQARWQNLNANITRAPWPRLEHRIGAAVMPRDRLEELEVAAADEKP